MFTKEHHHHLRKVVQIKSLLGRLYVHIVIQAFAVSLISVFIPIFLLVIGYSLAAVFLFLFVQWATFALFAPATGVLLRKIGVREVILIRTPLFVGALLMLFFIEHSLFLQRYFLLVAFLLGVSGVLYTLSIQSIFLSGIHKNKEGKDTGTFLSIPLIGEILGPVAGGTISLFFGFGSLFVFVAVILFLSVIPIFFIDHKVNHPIFTQKEMLGLFKKNKKYFSALCLYGIRSFIFFLFLPLAIYFLGHGEFVLGVIFSVVALVKVVFSIYYGKLADKYGKHKLFRIGALVNTVVVAIYGIFLQSPVLVILSLFFGIFSVMLFVPYEALLFQEAKKNNSPIAFMVFKELSLFAGRLLLFAVAFVVLDKLAYLFYLGSLSTLLMFFLV